MGTEGFPSRPGGPPFGLPFGASEERQFGRPALVLAVIVALICGVLCAGVAWNADARSGQEAAAHRHRVVATTTDRARLVPETRYAGAPTATAPAAWEFPSHTPMTGTIHVEPGTPRGRTVAIWVNDSGTYLPQNSLSVSQRALTTMAFGIVATGLVGLAETGGVLLLRRRAMNRRLDAWEREWDEVEPVWTGRLRREPGHDDD
ncbi:hypothetical protein [Streptomyces sp. ITFR-16]|uniref:Rv1733c family protein n=1 Tax=Streptomyces sp. ITFR-16 TaxID=3075198 RepID=UPI00288956D9|nr:hypothetical protein [Streptomyces sp. ITFR-16]WNI20517.1 hypothetical protein RLT58_00675 [Streptomyces sp. ITFR-16]